MYKVIIVVLLWMFSEACLPIRPTNGSTPNDYGPSIGFNIPLDREVLAKIGPASAYLLTQSRRFQAPLQLDAATGLASIAFSDDESGKPLVEGDALYGIRLEIVRQSDRQVVLSGLAQPSAINNLQAGYNDNIAVTLSCTAIAQEICGDGAEYEVIPRSAEITAADQQGLGRSDAQLDAAGGRSSLDAYGSNAAAACSCGPVQGWCLVWDSQTLKTIDGTQQHQRCDEQFCRTGFKAATYQQCAANTVTFVAGSTPAATDLDDISPAETDTAASTL